MTYSLLVLFFLWVVCLLSHYYYYCFGWLSSVSEICAVYCVRIVLECYVRDIGTCGAVRPTASTNNRWTCSLHTEESVPTGKWGTYYVCVPHFPTFYLHPMGKIIWQSTGRCFYYFARWHMSSESRLTIGPLACQWWTIKSSWYVDWLIFTSMVCLGPLVVCKWA
jgi:hypothetical protein